MNERYFVVRSRTARDLVDLARQAAMALRDRGADARDLALADALDGASTEVAIDLTEPVLA